jgi:TorA maturation chaperone TorD
MTPESAVADPSGALERAWGLLATAAERRGLAWRRLAEAFYGPDQAFTGALLAGRIEADLRLATSWLDSDRELFDPSLDALHRFVEAQAEAPSSTLHRVLEVEHARLFVGPGEVPAPPYESVWCDVDPDSGRHVFGGPSTASVAAAYREHGLVPEPGHHDLPDHVATEMELCCYLCEQEAKAWRSDEPRRAKTLRAAEQGFVTAHLARFAPELCAAVRTAAPESCYAAFAGFLLAQLTVESGTPYLDVVSSIWSTPGR